jgi:formylglycine-generating enzyme required for sulfatase activity
MFRKNLLVVWMGIMFLSGMFLMGQETWPPPTPNIASVVPDPARAGDPVTVTGTNFGATQGTSQLLYDEAPLTITSWSATEIVAVLPDPKAPGTYDVQVVVGTAVSNIVPHTIEAATGMAEIPAGCFDMGDHFGEGYVDELPVHNVCISAFEMDVHEVTNAEYAACVAGGGCTAPYLTSSYSRPTYYGDPAYDNFPVIWVDWYQARDYCTWAGKRLPTEAEWEYAARGGLAGKRYPWGDTISGTDANYYGSGDPWDNDTSEVEYYAANGYGLYDMAGNVSEWVNDWYQLDYYTVSPPNDPPGPVSGVYRVLRGGSWSFYYDLSYDLRVANRFGDFPVVEYFSIGFRCVR